MPPKVVPNYPEKPPKYKVKGFKLDLPIHAETLGNAYKTSRDIAREIWEEIVPFVQKARQRVDELIAIIQVLRREIREARDTLVLTNKTYLHPSLMVFEDLGDPLQWRKGDEDKEPQ